MHCRKKELYDLGSDEISTQYSWDVSLSPVTVTAATLKMVEVKEERCAVEPRKH